MEWLIGLAVSVALALAGLYWQRRGVKAQAEPALPAIEEQGFGPVEAAPGWFAITFLARNREPVRWWIELATVGPEGVKVLADEAIPRLVPPNEWTPAEVDLVALDPRSASGECALSMNLAPAGQKRNSVIRGDNDTETQSLWLFVPPRIDANSVSIVLSLRSSAVSERTFSRALRKNTKAKKITSPSRM